MDTPEKAHATLKDQQRERDRLMTENLNLKLRVKYLEDLFGEMPAGLPSVWDFDAIDKEHGRMLQIALNEIAERDQQLLQSSAELEAKDTKLGRAREELTRRERLFGSLKRRLELAEGRKIDEGELWATAGPDVAELEERCRAAQKEAESVVAQGAMQCEALEAERDALQADLAAQARQYAEVKEEASSYESRLRAAMGEVERFKKEAEEGAAQCKALASEVDALRSAGTPSGPRREADGLRAALANAEEELWRAREGMKEMEAEAEESKRRERGGRDDMVIELEGEVRERERLSAEVGRLMREREALVGERDRMRVRLSSVADEAGQQEATLLDEVAALRRDRDMMTDRLERARNELGDARQEVKELGSKWERAKEAICRHAAERDALLEQQRTLMERRRSSPPPEASDLDTHRLRECNRVLILELKDTRNRLVHEKRKTAMLAGSMQQQQQQQLEASAIGMSPGAVREASQPRHDSTPSSRYSLSKGQTSQQHRSPLSQVDVNRS